MNGYFKRIICIVLLLLFLLPTFANIVHAEENMPEITAESAILIDSVSGEVIFERNADEKMYPASMTKMMVLLIAMEKLEEGSIALSDSVTITEEAASLGGTQLFLEAGEVRTVEELLYATAVESANDAATALGIHIAGSFDGFISMMNQKCKEIGMSDTNFTNACGLHEDNHYTTAKDMATLSRKLLEHEEVLKYTDTWTIDVYIGKKNDKLRSLANTNKLISQYDYIDGLKTGFTEESGHCMAATGKRDKTRLVAVVMKSADAKARFSDAKALLDYGFSNYSSSLPIEKGDKSGEITVINGVKEKVKLIADDDIYLFRKKGELGNIQLKAELNTASVNAPVNKGTVFGKAVVYDGEKNLGSVNLVAAEDVEKCSLGEYLGRVKEVVLF